jgi:RNA polymerase sigma-70 factor (ECF subfamily)
VSRSPAFECTPERREELVASFVASFVAARDGDLAGLEKLLAADVTWTSDGGGTVSAARRPVEGSDKVGWLTVGWAERVAVGLDFTTVEVNGSIGLAAWAGDTLVGVFTLELRDGLITHVRVALNPDKLDFVRRQLTRP